MSRLTTVNSNYFEASNLNGTVVCFESYRRNTKNPEIITFDELYKRAEFIVTNKTQTQKDNISEIDEHDDLPF